MKYTREVLEKAVAQSVSVFGVMRLLGIKYAGGSHGHIKRRIAQFGLDTTHFTGRASNTGASHKGGKKKIQAQDVLVYGRRAHMASREESSRLRRALVEAGVVECCAVCGNGPSWQGRPLCLQIDHKDGDRFNNLKDNLRFLCPNCHSQTETFGSRRRSPKAEAIG